MNMHNPAHPGKVFDESFLKHVDLTISSAAHRLGISRKHLSNIIHGRANVTADVAKRFEALTGSKAEFWLNMQNAYDLWKLRNVSYDIKKVAA